MSVLTIDQLADREAIRDCLLRYCRGIDRSDEAALRSAYWPDGTDDHGPYQGSAAGFIEWALKRLPSIELSIHQLHNILIELRDTGAAVETYFTALQRQPRGDGTLVQLDMKGRYLDWFERRGTEWRVLHRVVVFDWIGEMPLPTEAEAASFALRRPAAANSPDDPLYALLQRTG